MWLQLNGSKGPPPLKSASRRLPCRPRLEPLEDRCVPALGLYLEDFASDLPPDRTQPGFDSWDADPTTLQPGPDELHILNNLPPRTDEFAPHVYITPTGGIAMITRTYNNTSPGPYSPYMLHLNSVFHPQGAQVVFSFSDPGEPGGFNLDEEVAVASIDVRGGGAVQFIGANAQITFPFETNREEMPDPPWQHFSITRNHPVGVGGTPLGAIQQIIVETFGAMDVNRISVLVLEKETPSDVIANDDYAVVSQRQLVPGVTFSWRQNDVHLNDLGDVDLEPLTLVSNTQPGYGEVVMDNASGTAYYIPQTSFFGRDSFEYTIRDDDGHTNTATVILEVTNNLAPVVFDTTVHPVHFLTGGLPLRVRCEDADGDPVNIADFSPPTEGTIVPVRSDTSDPGVTYFEFDYLPRLEFFGASDRFTFKVDDGHAVSNVGTVNIVVAQAAPEASDDPAVYGAYTEDGIGDPIWIHDFSYVVPDYYAGKTVRLGGRDGPRGLLANDSDADGDPLQAFRFDGPIPAPQHGLVTLESDGSFTYLPAEGFNGPDFFTYKVTDGFSESNVGIVKVLVVGPPHDLESARGAVQWSG